MSSLGKRLAATVGLVLAVLALLRIPPAGVDGEALRAASGVDLGLSLASLGIAPALWAYLLVELVAAAVPALRPWRDDPSGRAKLERAVGVVFVSLTVLQAAATTLAVERAVAFTEVPPPTRLLFGASLTGGCVLLFILARWATRSGLTSGFSTVMVVLSGAEVARALAGPTWLLGRVYVAIVLGLVVTVASVATWLAVRKLGPSDLVGTEPTGTPYRGSAKDAPAWAPVLPVPTSTLLPFAVATWLIGALASYDVRAGGALRAGIVLGASLVLTPLLGRFLQRPSAIAATLRRLGANEAPELLEAAVQTRLRSAERSSLAYFAALAVAVLLAEMTREARISLVALPVAVALLMDGVAAFSLHRRARVCVMESQRPHETMAMLQALGNHGIRAASAGVATSSLLQVLGPFAPATLWVSPEDVDEARAFIEARRAGEPAPLTPPEARTPVPAGWAPRKRFRALITVVCTMVAVGVVLGANELWHARSEGPPRARTSLEVSAVDDESEWAESIALEPGATLERESAPLGPGRTGMHATVRIALEPGEPESVARARANAWLARCAPPPGGRFALEDVEGPGAPGDEDRRISALRVVVLTGEPILTGRDVQRAVALPPRDGQDAQVLLSLAPEGARRFEEATRRLVRRRMAIVTGDAVRSVPVVMSAIVGGHISITMGRGNPDARYREARDLAMALDGSVP